MKKNYVSLLLAGVLALSLLAGCGSKTEEEPQQEIEQPVAVTEEQPEAPVEEEVVYTPAEASYLTGEPLDSAYLNYRPLAFMMPNDDYGAVPQVGLSNAGVIYEAPVEGRYTRLMCIFDRQYLEQTEKIGPVRSCRLYYPQFALEFNAIYCHFGEASYATEFLDSGEVDDIDGLTTDGDIFYRDENRKAPNNAFTSGTELIARIQSRGFSETYREDYQGHFKFASTEVTDANGIDATYIKPGYPVNKPWFEYNAEDGMYYRYQYGEQHIDAGTGEQLKVKNIILQYVPAIELDDKGYLEMDTMAGGTGYYITNGKATALTWSKDGLHSTVHYYDENGNEIEINTGKTWVCVVRTDAWADVVVSTPEEVETVEANQQKYYEEVTGESDGN